MEPNEMVRYDLVGEYDLDIAPQAEGDYVHYSEAMQVIQTLQAKIDGMIERPAIDYESYESVTVNGVVILGDVGDAWWVNHKRIADNLTKALGMDDAKEGGKG